MSVSRLPRAGGFRSRVVSLLCTACYWRSGWIGNAERQFAMPLQLRKIELRSLRVWAWHNLPMPNIASVLKAEIVRLARKELRGEVDAIRKSLAAARADSAALKRRVSDLERTLRHLTRTGETPVPASTPAEDTATAESLRFRASGLTSNRKRLGLSAADFGLLVGASGQSVYAWEQGKARPRGKNLAAIAALRGVGKREVVERLGALKSGRQS